MINGHALCPPFSFVRRCDPFPPGTAVERPQRVRTNDLDGRRSVELPGDGHHGHGMWLSAEQRPLLIRRSVRRGWWRHSDCQLMCAHQVALGASGRSVAGDWAGRRGSRYPHFLGGAADVSQLDLRVAATPRAEPVTELDLPPQPGNPASAARFGWGVVTRRRCWPGCGAVGDYLLQDQVVA